tara:strand:- start:454 stop:720 length:267 start_codon:yes stop_codon:yes gene_type:complete
VIFAFAVLYFDELAEAFDKLGEVTGNIIQGEENLAEQLKLREEILAELDGIEMTDEEIDKVVESLMKSSPNRIKLNTELEKLYQKMRG